MLADIVALKIAEIRTAHPGAEIGAYPLTLAAWCVIARIDDGARIVTAVVPGDSPCEVLLHAARLGGMVAVRGHRADCVVAHVG